MKKFIFLLFVFATLFSNAQQCITPTNTNTEAGIPKYNLNPNSSSENHQYNSNSGAVHYYTNSTEHRVQSPTHYIPAPANATAKCNDGTYSFSENHRGTCSHHGGVAQWYK